MTKSIHQFQLVDTTYSLSESKEVLLSLINDKINFINMTIFSREERFGDDCQHLRRRVQELNQVKSNLLDYFNDIQDQDCMVEIDCPVNIKIKVTDTNQDNTVEVTV